MEQKVERNLRLYFYNYKNKKIDLNNNNFLEKSLIYCDKGMKEYINMKMVILIKIINSYLNTFLIVLVKCIHPSG